VKYRLNRPAKEILSLPIDIYRVFYRKKPPLQHLWLTTFEDLKDFIKYIYRTQDIEAISAFRFVRKYKNPYEILQEIEDGEDREAELVLTTAHAAKGLEWRKVTIWDDFPDPAAIASSEGCITLKDCLEMEKRGEYSKTIEEMNLAYVAITRAVGKLDCGIDWVYEVNTESDFNERIKKAYENQIKQIKEEV
jgi:superfamily I DNA/RNA helicase